MRFSMMDRSIDGYNDIRVGDVIEAYEFEEVAPSLS